MVCYGISGVVKSKKCLAYEGASNQPTYTTAGYI